MPGSPTTTLRFEPDGPRDVGSCEFPTNDSNFGIGVGSTETVPGRLVGRRLGGVEIESFVAAGGMGEVYLGREVAEYSAGREVAVKVVRPDRATRDELRRFANEIRMLGGINDPRIARIHYGDRAAIDGIEVPYFVMDLIADARRIDDHVRDGAAGRRLDRRSIVELFVEVVDAIAVCHARGIVHRDLKPGNILVDASGKPHVVDFGIACRAGDAAAIPAGTPAYMSPEQARGELVDCRFDVYSLGVVLSELLTGRPPRAAWPAVIAPREVGRVPREPRSTPHVSDPALDAIVADCLATDPRRRPASARELQAALQAWLEQPRSTRRRSRGQPRRPEPLGYEFLESKIAFAGGPVVSQPPPAACEPPAQVLAAAAVEPLSAGTVATVPPGTTVPLTAAGLASRLPDARARRATVRNLRLARGGGDGQLRPTDDGRWTLEVGPLQPREGSVLTVHFEVYDGDTVAPATAVVLVQPTPGPGPAAFAAIAPRER